MKRPCLEQLEQIPGVGKNIAQDMRNIGIGCVDDLKSQDPEQLYERLCEIKVIPADKCVLYIFRCAVYRGSNTEHEPELLK